MSIGFLIPTGIRGNNTNIDLEQIRKRAKGSNKLSDKYKDETGIETLLGSMIFETGFCNVVDLNRSSYLPTAIFHAVKFFETSDMEVIWRMLDHGMIRSDTDVVWYIIERGRTMGTFHFFESTKTESEASSVSHFLQKIIMGDPDIGPGSLCATANGTISIDRFIERVIHLDPWLLYNSLKICIPSYMEIHKIIHSSISNRRKKLQRQKRQNFS